MEKILWSYGHCGTKIRMTGEVFRNYEKLKKHIFYKIVSYERNRELLKKIPHRKILDLAMVFYYQVEDEETPATVMIQNNHLNLWKITEDQLVENAKKYTCLFMPAEFLTMAQVAGIEEDELEEMTGEKRRLCIF